MKGWRTWVKGLVSAASGALVSGLAVSIADPMKFGFENPENIKRLIFVCGVTAAVAVLSYLKQSPLPNGK